MTKLSEKVMIEAILAMCDLIEEYVGSNNSAINKVRKAVSPKKAVAAKSAKSKGVA